MNKIFIHCVNHYKYNGVKTKICGITDCLNQAQKTVLLIMNGQMYVILTWDSPLHALKPDNYAEAGVLVVVGVMDFATDNSWIWLGCWCCIWKMWCFRGTWCTMKLDSLSSSLRSIFSSFKRWTSAVNTFFKHWTSVVNASCRAAK